MLQAAEELYLGMQESIRDMRIRESAMHVPDPSLLATTPYRRGFSVPCAVID